MNKEDFITFSNMSKKYKNYLKHEEHSLISKTYGIFTITFKNN